MNPIFFRIMKPLVPTVLLISTLFISFPLAGAPEKKPPLPTRPSIMVPDREDARTCIDIVKVLQRYHYSKKKLDNNLSGIIFERYIDHLDPSKSLFTKGDINGFEKFKYRLDNTLGKGDLKPGFHIYNLFIERSFERLTYIRELLKVWQTTFDFTKDELINVDRSDLPWPRDAKALRTLWKKQLKNEILIHKLDKETDHEITETLQKRYDSRLTRLSQTDKDDTFRTYINAVTMGFDPHTQYFPPRVSEDFDIQMSLSLEGIGAVLQSEYEYTKVVRLITAGPADKSDQLMPGDKIIGVGQDLSGEIQDVVGWRIDEVVKLIRGPKGSHVRLQIIPAEKKGRQNSKIIQIQRDEVKLEEQAAKKKLVPVEHNGQTYKIGIIDIPTFYQDFKAYQAGDKNYRSTTRDVRNLLQELKQEGIDGLIVNLRNNGGGSLQEVNELVGLFIKQGPTVQIKGRNGRMSSLSDTDPSILYKGPLLVMINRMSASASEIFAGAIKDYNRGVIIGSPTFGKGTVQALQSLGQGQLKLTSAKFYRVSGESTQNLGVKPDIAFPHIYNNQETGESSLAGALPWDKSRRADYHSYQSLTPLIKLLKEHHGNRSRNNPPFQYLNKKYKLALDIYGIKSWSLNENKRKQEQKRLKKLELDIENELLAAQGKPLLKTLDDLEKTENDNGYPHGYGNGNKNKDDAGDGDNDGDDDDDYLLTESEQILADFITLSTKNNYTW